MTSSLAPNLNPLAAITTTDTLKELLADKCSPNTRRAYAKNLRDFFNTVVGSEPNLKLIAEFLTLDRFSAISLVLKYKSVLVDRGLTEATINRRLAAIKSLVNYARRIGKCDYSLEDVKGEKIQPYRDTTGISTDSFRLLLAVPDRSTLKGNQAENVGLGKKVIAASSPLISNLSLPGSENSIICKLAHIKS